MFFGEHNSEFCEQDFWINRNTINAYYNEIWEKILANSLKEQKKELGEIEVDESYFGARRVRRKRGRGTAGKMKVFGSY